MVKSSDLMAPNYKKLRNKHQVGQERMSPKRIIIIIIIIIIINKIKLLELDKSKQENSRKFFILITTWSTKK